jgi:quercetin dioxygenase-like cupin family protein
MAASATALLNAETIAAMEERRFQHMFNANGVRMTRSLSDTCGMTQLGVHLVRVEPGHESTEYHTHSHDEEWIYILSGRATADIDGRTTEVKAGDFMGFVAHHEKRFARGPVVPGRRHAPYVRRGRLSASRHSLVQVRGQAGQR